MLRMSFSLSPDVFVIGDFGVSNSFRISKFGFQKEVGRAASRHSRDHFPNGFAAVGDVDRPAAQVVHAQRGVDPQQLVNRCHHVARGGEPAALASTTEPESRAVIASIPVPTKGDSVRNKGTA